MQQLYFIRHGESEFNKAHKWAGSTNVALTDQGHAQATATGQAIRAQGLQFDVIIVSPLLRAHDTAKHVAQEIDYPIENIIILPELTERNYGSLEGRRDLVEATRYAVDESAIDNHEGVESLADLQARANAVLDYLHSLPYDNILVVGHGASGRALRRAVKNEPLSKRGMQIGNAELIQLL